MLVLISELVGTMFLLMVINWSSVTNSTPQCAGFTVALLIQLFGSISGGHFNPAVSLGFLFKEGAAHWARNFGMFIAMIIAQGIGALLGVVISTGGFDMTEMPSTRKIQEDGYHVAQLCPSNGCNDEGELVLKVFITEAVCTFVFVSFIFMVVKHNGGSEMPINALAIGTMLYLAITMASGISGGCINPAVGLVQSVYMKTMNASKFPNAPPTSLIYVGCYIGGPFVGSFFASWFFKLSHEKAILQAQEMSDEEYSKM